MAQFTVVHKTYGNGVVTKIKGDYIHVKFGSDERQFALKGFDKFFTYNDIELKCIISKANDESQTVSQNSSVVNQPRSAQKNYGNVDRTSYVDAGNVLLGPRAQTISITSESQMYEIVGYMATPGRISSIEAEVPMDGRDTQFEQLFPGQTYRPITLGETPSGLPNKLSPQFRINFANLRNCPQILKANMGAGNMSCVGRINKSRFVLFVVQNYGFRFGDRQDVNKIRNLAIERGYIEDFERGYKM